MDEHTTPLGCNTITRSLHCMGCRYQLKGLAESGDCPECGLPIVESMRGRTGDMLEDSPADYLRRVYNGLLINLASIVALAVLSVGQGVASLATWLLRGSGSSASVIVAVSGWSISVLLSLAMAYGWWVFSTPDPSAEVGNRGERARALLRVLTIVNVAMVLINAAAGLVAMNMMSAASAPGQGGAGPNGMPQFTGALLGMGLLAMALSLLGLVVAGLLSFAAMLYVNWLVARVANEKMRNYASVLLWLVPLLYTVGSCIIVGPLAAQVLLVIMLEWLRRDLKAIRMDRGDIMA